MATVGNSPPTELVYLFGVDSQVTQAACKTMQHWGSFPVQSLDMARPLSRTIPVALAIMLAISSNAIDARELEVQHSSVKQKPSTSIPWPRSRPKEAQPEPQGNANTWINEDRAVEQRSQEPGAPSDCRLRLTPDLGAIQALPPISSGQCAAEDVVRVDAVVAHDGRPIPITPPATLRCPMAEAVIHWVRDELSSIAAEFGGPLKKPERVVVIEFPDMASISAWYNSAEYQPLIALRKAATSDQDMLFVLEGA